MGKVCGMYGGEEWRSQGNLGERDHWEDLGIDREKPFKVDLQDVGWGRGLDCSCSGQVGQVAGFCERGNEPSGVIKCRVFLD